MEQFIQQLYSILEIPDIKKFLMDYPNVENILSKKGVRFKKPIPTNVTDTGEYIIFNRKSTSELLNLLT